MDYAHTIGSGGNGLCCITPQEEFYDSMDAIDIGRNPQGSWSGAKNNNEKGRGRGGGGFDGEEAGDGESAYDSKETERLLDQARRQMVEKGQSDLLQVR